MTIPQFQKKILLWYRKNRRDPRTRASSVRGRLPWRNTKNPYRILVSEVMLQQTQVSRVLPKYEEFLKAFPTLEKLAKTPDKKLLKVWSGLGYWRRALNLKETAKTLSNLAQFERKLFDPIFLETLPGIGHYTARALACFAFGNSEAFLDTNIRRVYLHFFFKNKKDVSDKQILPLAQKALHHVCHGRRKHVTTPREWHYALFDYGATVLKDKKINKQSRHYAKQSRFEGSFRSFRSKVMHFLLYQRNQTATKDRVVQLLKEVQNPYSPERVLEALEKDGLIKKSKNHYFL